MFSYIELAFAWMLFISLFILSAGMFYRANKHYASWKSMQAGVGVERPSDQAMRLQLYSAITNIACGFALCLVIMSILVFGLAFAIWSGIAAVLVWAYYMTSLVLERRRVALASS